MEPSMSVKVKICGLRRRDDVDRAVELGVEMLGFNCWPESPRYVEPSLLRALVARVPAPSEVVLVFVRAAPAEVHGVLSSLDLPRERVSVQLHGDEDPRVYAHLEARIVPVIRVKSEEVRAREVYASPRVLLDVHAPEHGGTGRRIAPETVRRLVPSLPREWILAGGLDARCVRGAIPELRPWGVDVASGVESAPGVKDHRKLEAFVEAARSVESEARNEEACPT
jgi:phosphoribosylanthranilate isomerase